MDFIVHKPAVDYITATTFSAESYRRTVKKIRGESPVSPESSKRMQYYGHKEGSIFYGEGEQGQEAHYMIDISGAVADDHYMTIIDAGMTITRLDLQVTIELPSWYKARSFIDTLRKGIWINRQRGCRLIENDDGSDTVYVGSLKSDKFIRFYVKQVSYLRYEIQLRRKYAESAASQIANGGKNAVRGILLAELDKLPTHPTITEFRPFVTGSAIHVQAYRVNADAAAKMRWLASLLGTILQICNDHDYGHTAIAWLQEVINDAQRN